MSRLIGKFKGYLTGFIVCLSATGTVWAASHEQPGEAGFGWDGIYVGALAGGYFGDTTITSLTGVVTPPTGNVGNAGGSTNGILGGALFGFNMRNGDWIFGAEADIGWSNADGNGTGIPTPPTTPPTTTPAYKYDVGLIGHVRGRIGALVTPNTLIFAAGGLAFADIDVTETTGTTGWNGASIGGLRYGWTIGAGIEQSFGERVSGRLEYLYDDFGSRTYTHGTSSYSSKANAHVIRATLNFKLY